MKSSVKIILTVLFIVLFSFSASATTAENITANDIIERQKEEYGINDLDKNVPESAKKSAEDYGNLKLENAENLLDAKKIIGFVFQCFFKVLSQKGSILLKLAAMLVLIYVVSTMSTDGANGGIMKALSYITLVIAALILFDTVFTSANTLIDSFNDLSIFMGSLTPVLLAVTGASGAPAAAGTAGLTLTAALEVFSVIVNSCVLPCTNMYLALGAGGGITSNMNLKNLSVFVRNFAVGIISFILCIFTGVMSVQSFISVSGDSLSRRTMKFAAGSFIPIAGGSIGDGLDTVFTCAAVLKSSVGAFGIIVLFFTIITPLLDIVANIIILSIAKSICVFFNNNTLSSFFSITKDAFSILFTVAAGFSIMIILALTIMIRIGG